MLYLPRRDKSGSGCPIYFEVILFVEKAAFAKTLGYYYRRESDSSVTVNHRKSSDCQFEFQTYSDVQKWCDDYKSLKIIKTLSIFVS